MPPVGSHSQQPRHRLPRRGGELRAVVHKDESDHVQISQLAVRPRGGDLFRRTEAPGMGTGHQQHARPSGNVGIARRQLSPSVDNIAAEQSTQGADARASVQAYKGHVPDGHVCRLLAFAHGQGPLSSPRGMHRRRRASYLDVVPQDGVRLHDLSRRRLHRWRQERIARQFRHGMPSSF